MPFYLYTIDKYNKKNTGVKVILFALEFIKVESLHSRGQHLCKFNGTSVYTELPPEFVWPP